MYGMSNSTTLETINLSNIQIYDTRIISSFNLTWFLEPIQDCPIRRLHLASNSFNAIYPGIIRCTPLLEYIDVSHNQLVTLVSDVPLLSSAFFQETLLHKRLQEIDFSSQGFVYHDLRTGEQICGLLNSNPTFPELEKYTNRRRNLSTGTFQQRVESFIPYDVAPEHWPQCIDALRNDPCEIFIPNCSDTLDYLRHNHGQFCELLYVLFYPAYEEYYRGIPCSALPAVDDLFQKKLFSLYCLSYYGFNKAAEAHQWDYLWRKVHPSTYQNVPKYMLSSIKPTGIP